MSVKADKQGADVKCDGFNLAAAPCPNTLGFGWPSGQAAPRSQAEAERSARRIAKTKGWKFTSGSDLCPRIHSGG